MKRDLADTVKGLGKKLDAITCNGCRAGWRVIEADPKGTGIGSQLRRHVYQTDEDNTNYYALCTSKREQIEPAIRDLIAQATADALEAAVCDLGELANKYESGSYGEHYLKMAISNIRALSPADIAAKAKEREQRHDASLVCLSVALDQVLAWEQEYRTLNHLGQKPPDPFIAAKSMRDDVAGTVKEHDAKIKREAQEEYAEKHAEAHRQQILLLMGDKGKLKEELRAARREAYRLYVVIYRFHKRYMGTSRAHNHNRTGRAQARSRRRGKVKHEHIATANCLDSFKTFKGCRVVGAISNADRASSTTLIFDCGWGLTVFHNGSFWVTEPDKISWAKRRMKEELQAAGV